MNVNDKVFLVTGAGGGIGGAIVDALLSRGAKVAAVDLKEESLKQLVDRLGENKNKVSTHAIDITDRDAVSRLPKDVIDKQGNIDAIINCAGIIQPFVKVVDIDYKAIERVMNVNFFGTLYITKAFLPYLLKRPEGYIANISSMGGFLPVPGQSIYGASKAAVKLMTEGLYAELLNTNIHVSIIYPGATNTDISKHSGVEAPAGSTETASKIKMLSAEECAEIIVKGIEANKPQIFTGSDSKMMNKLYRLNPVYATKLIAKQMSSLLK